MIELIGLVFLKAVPPPFPQLTADCTHPVYASDQLVCGDPLLQRVDAQLASALERGQTRTGPWIEDGGAWFRRSRLCSLRPDHRRCLIEAYRERRTVLTAAARTDRGKQCGSLRIAAMPDGSIALYDKAGGIVGVALRASLVWKPFIRIGSTNRFLDLAGKEIARCG
ncbi:hypothetical protein [Sphingomonas sp. Leaf22]|uniref:hypothetical protein n=1 Tax=Sphingomonas sp. Leaf22 TaxID=1735687 RepID=UPI0012E26990|nr:hypothetical protein [Sphingomonas sp. Leaf22]